MMRLLRSSLLAMVLLGGLSGSSDGAGRDATPRPAVAAPYIWKNVAIGGGGFVTGIITHPAEKGLMYARTDVGGAYRSDDAGHAWVPLTDWVGRAQSNLMGCESIAIDPADPNRIYLALGTYTASWSGNGALVRSTDRGRTFQQANLPFKLGANESGRSGGERLAVDPNAGQILFFGSRGAGLWKSDDWGATWKSLASFPAIAPSASPTGERRSPVGIVNVAFDQSSGTRGTPTPTIYCGASSAEIGLFRSTDGGESWSAVPGQPSGLLPNHMARAGDGTLFLSYGDEPGPERMTDGAIWKFEPRIERWTDVTPVKPSRNDRFGYGAVAANTSHPGIIVASSFCRWGAGDTIFRSTDAGRTWSHQRLAGNNRDPSLFDASAAPYANSLAPHWIGDVVIDPFDGNHVLFTTGYGIWATQDVAALDRGQPAHWAFTDSGLEETVPLALASPPSGAHLLSAIGDFDGFRHDDLDVSPAAGRFTPHLGSNSTVDFAAHRPDIVVRAGAGGHGLYSLDGGAAWTKFPACPLGADGGGTIAVAADGATFVWASTNSQTSYSQDRGSTWAACGGLPRLLAPVADRVNPRKFYAYDRRDGILYVSADRGKTFSPSATGLPAGGGDNALQAVPGFEGDLWLIATGRLFRSTDSGRNFSQQDELTNVFKCGFGRPAPGRGFPATYVVACLNGVEGIYRSDDAGKTWIPINDNQHQFGWINAITGDPRIYGRVYLGTGGRGILYGDPRAGS